ncbi:MAG: GNAT family N-acetyltransferase [Cyclobacteriaceae bacterium]|nr:GNAT family N-acetyltransferase [Cyclobacteriaceae bacterium]
MNTIRPYKATDSSQLIKLFELNTPSYFDPSEQAAFESFLKSSPVHYFVVQDGNKLVGCGGFDVLDNGTKGRLAWDFFHPDVQGKGYGTLLINYCLEELKIIESIKTIDVRTSQFAYTFYARFGFELIEIKEDYWATGFDLYYMKLVVDRHLLQ